MFKGKSKYYNALSAELDLSFDSFRFLEERDLSPLDAKVQASLRERAYKRNLEKTIDTYWTTERASKFLEVGKPEWMRDSDYATLKTRAEGIIKIENQKQRYSELKSLINTIINQNSITDTKPEELTDEQWAVIEPHLPELPSREDGRGRPWRENREVMNGILWILRSGATCSMIQICGN